MNTEHCLQQFEQFLMRQDLAQRTVKGYLDDLRYFQHWLTEIQTIKAPLLTITVMELQAFRQYLVNAKRQKVTSVNRRIQALRRFFNWAVHMGHISESPADSIRFMRRQPPSKPAALDKAEVHHLLRAAGLSSHGLAKRNYAMIQLMLQAGLRIGEVVQLRYGDIISEARSGKVMVVDGKGHKSRTIPLNLTARRAFNAYFETRQFMQPTDHVFTSKRDKPITLRAAQAMLSSLIKRAKLTRIAVSAHTLRHTFASNYLKANPNQLVELAQLLGHDSLNTTAIYTKSTQAQLADALERSEINIYGND